MKQCLERVIDAQFPELFENKNSYLIAAALTPEFTDLPWCTKLVKEQVWAGIVEEVKKLLPEEELR